MFSKYAKRKTASVFVVTLFVHSASHSFRFLNERIENIGLPDRVDSLNKSQNTFKPSTSIDAWLRQRSASAITALVVLHEHQVPELHKAITCWIVCRASIGAKGWSTIDVDFRTWTTWSCVARLPEIVFVAETLNSFHRNAYLLMPDLFCFVIRFMNRDPQFVSIETENFSY